MLRIALPESGFVWQGKMVLPGFTDYLKNLEENFGKFDFLLARGEGTYELLWNFDDPRFWLMIEAVVGRFHNRAPRPGWLLRKLYENKNIVCVSEGIKQGLEKICKEESISPNKVKVIYNAIPLEEIKIKSTEDYHPKFEQPYLLHVARLVPEKCPTLLIDAYQLARKKGITAPLVIIGDGSEMLKLKEMVKRYELGDHVHFLGMQDNPYPWMAKANVLVLNSNFEGLGLVLIEAHALGTQCIATDVPGGIREVLIDTQKDLISEHNAESLAEKMAQSLEDPIEVKPEWAQRFSSETIVPQFIALSD